PGARRRPGSAEHGLRPAHCLHRRARVLEAGARDLFQGGGGDHGPVRGPTSLGQGPLPERGHAAATLSTLGQLPVRARPPGPAPDLREPVSGTRPRLVVAEDDAIGELSSPLAGNAVDFGSPPWARRQRHVWLTTMKGAYMAVPASSGPILCRRSVPPPADAPVQAQ